MYLKFMGNNIIITFVSDLKHSVKGGIILWQKIHGW